MRPCVVSLRSVRVNSSNTSSFSPKKSLTLTPGPYSDSSPANLSYAAFAAATRLPLMPYLFACVRQ